MEVVQAEVSITRKLRYDIAVKNCEPLTLVDDTPESQYGSSAVQLVKSSLSRSLPLCLSESEMD